MSGTTELRITTNGTMAGTHVTTADGIEVINVLAVAVRVSGDGYGEATIKILIDAPTSGTAGGGDDGGFIAENHLTDTNGDVLTDTKDDPLECTK